MSAAGPRCPTMPGVDRVPFLTNTSMVALDRVPKHLVVVGGSYIGLEFAPDASGVSAAEVTVVEKGPRLDRPRGRGHVRRRSGSILEGEGIARAHRRRVHPLRAGMASGVAVGLDCSEGAPEVRGSTCCSPSAGAPTPTISASSRPASPSTSAARSRSTTGLATSVPGIWALGDCNGRGAFTHTAYNDFEIVAANLLDGENCRVARAHRRPMPSMSIRRSAASA